MFFQPFIEFLIKTKMAARMATMFGVCDVRDLQQRYHPQKTSHLVEKVKGFLLKAKSFRNIATYQKPEVGGSINPPLLFTTVGV